MGRVILIVLIVLALVLLWKAFGPGSWNQAGGNQPREIKGPDDDEEFLWTLEKNRFKARRAQEEAARQEEERIRRARERYTSHKPEHDDAPTASEDADDHRPKEPPEEPPAENGKPEA
ncbi:hypothetical protein CATYP_01730 [Corynebacterium atypicum]|uniref:Secreted protein n=1 Tax=Corynebacterium atypicum TaxID=191610 RepID=A0ABN4DB81_9CORY|nr:hypothetical protein [Corynebacterium atypicum]AIG63610.1 hypothetical protein CATYP_01730 [Corynebacterium atypicum]